jgi:hypothetical protein
MTKVLIRLLVLGFLWSGLASGDPPTELQPRRGCCSHHHGVCGCENGRAACCDGTLSPTCGCD